MHDIGIIGDYESICGFSAIGFDTAFVTSREEARNELLDMIEKDYTIIFMASKYFFETNHDKTCVIPLPDINSSLGKTRIENLTEKAAGSKL